MADAEFKEYPTTGTRMIPTPEGLKEVPIYYSREHIGKLLEEITCKAFKLLQQPYVYNGINGLGADFIVPANYHTFLVEAKNFSGKYPLSPYIFKTEVLSRFTVQDPKHRYEWILVISKLNCSQEVSNLIQQHNITVIQTGQQIRRQSNQDKQKISRYLSKQLHRVFSILLNPTAASSHVSHLVRRSSSIFDVKLLSYSSNFNIYEIESHQPTMLSHNRSVKKSTSVSTFTGDAVDG